jgi:hypothetical protein
MMHEITLNLMVYGFWISLGVGVFLGIPLAIFAYQYAIKHPDGE